MYEVKFTEQALRSLRKLDKQIARLILAWIEKHLDGCEDPRVKGKALTNDRTGVWRYRVGDYRILANIKDHELLILVVDAGHRKDIYR